MVGQRSAGSPAGAEPAGYGILLRPGQLVRASVLGMAADGRVVLAAFGTCFPVRARGAVRPGSYTFRVRAEDDGAVAFEVVEDGGSAPPTHGTAGPRTLVQAPPALPWRVEEDARAAGEGAATAALDGERLKRRIEALGLDLEPRVSALVDLPRAEQLEDVERLRATDRARAVRGARNASAAALDDVARAAQRRFAAGAALHAPLPAPRGVESADLYWWPETTRDGGLLPARRMALLLRTDRLGLVRVDVVLGAEEADPPMSLQVHATTPGHVESLRSLAVRALACLRRGDAVVRERVVVRVTNSVPVLDLVEPDGIGAGIDRRA